MRRLDCGTAGACPSEPGPTWQALGLGSPWLDVVAVLAADTAPRPVQVEALGRLRLLEQRRHAIVAAPTSAGKSLVGLLALLDAVRRGQRGVLLEPLRAVAREKHDELQAARTALGRALGRPFTVRITTGDYRLDHETFASPPPEAGELIVATPERFDALLRNPVSARWVASLGCVCVDEAHLIGTPRRGLTLEYLLTALCCLPTAPRLVLLSASLGDLDRAQAWLSPCEVVRVTHRFPSLHKEVWELAGVADEGVARWAEEALSDPTAQLLVFVYTTRGAEKLAEDLRDPLGTRAGVDGPLAYHARMAPARREAARNAFVAGRSRCLVATTALGLGVNLPATHVLVRDTTFAGVGPLPLADLLQMMGRAGRGDRPGQAVALVRPHDGWAADELALALREERLPGLVSSLDQPSPRDPATTAGPVLAQLLRWGEQGLTLAEVQGFFARSLGARMMAGQVAGLLGWLCDAERCLAYADEQGRYRPTVLGRQAARALLPLDLAAGAARLVRDLLSVDEQDHYLGRWQDLDHLVLLELLRPYSLPGRRFSEKLAGQVDAWMEGRPPGSLLYREWLRGAPGSSRAGEVLGSLGISPADEDAARQNAYLAVFRAVVLLERASGQSTTDLQRRWGVDPEGVEERWRDDRLWLLAGLAGLFEVRCFYYHLREACSASTERIRRIERLFRRLRAGVFELQDQLRCCSALGPMLRSLRRARRSGEEGTVGVRTIRRLEEAGVRTVADVARLSVDDLVRLGVRRSLAEQVCAYVKRRLA
jgi:superfamily II DNA/RNA helicase